MNPGKSTRGDNESFPRSLVMSIEPHPEGEAVTVWRVTEDGRSETESLILRYDGRDHPYPQQDRYETFNARRMPGEVIEILYKKRGEVVARQIRQIASGGREMRIQCQFFSPEGRRHDRVLVFER